VLGDAEFMKLLRQSSRANRSCTARGAALLRRRTRAGRSEIMPSNVDGYTPASAMKWWPSDDAEFIVAGTVAKWARAR
jgi:hypothetical protein